MIYLSLPHMHRSFNFNNFLKEHVTENKQNNKIFKVPFEIEMVYGSLPFSYWNGDLNNNYNSINSKFLLYNDIDLFFQNSFIPVCIDCSNLLLEETDLNDIHQNVILSLGNNSGNYVEVSNLAILNYVKEKYNNYGFVLSKNADLAYPFNSEIINNFIKEDLFYLINLPDRMKQDTEELKKISNKNKIAITIGNRCCSCDKEKISQCLLQEQENQFRYSGHTVYNCKYINDYSAINLLDEIDYYRNLGFSHFKLDAPPYNKIELFQIYLLQNLISPEYIIPITNRIFTEDFI